MTIICLCFYDIALWENFHVSVIGKLASAYRYIKCLKLYFGFSKYSSVTAVLLQLGVPSFNTVLHNAKLGFYTRLSCFTRAVVNAL